MLSNRGGDQRSCSAIGDETGTSCFAAHDATIYGRAFRCVFQEDDDPSSQGASVVLSKDLMAIAGEALWTTNIKMVARRVVGLAGVKPYIPDMHQDGIRALLHPRRAGHHQEERLLPGGGEEGLQEGGIAETGGGRPPTEPTPERREHDPRGKGKIDIVAKNPVDEIEVRGEAPAHGDSKSVVLEVLAAELEDERSPGGQEG
ncbi:hypothetical protein E2562_016408 [Oryza meyeriana var. granulata]|uniref:FAE domain-containing protein n=1 Tax=Oryza meyeriana var. granulata TaxID=110450 RepID=A0A6G1EX61_9ORYZ|nr:hypothetical protein E2562_016408 [Oryza meyeriana var. granulata]